MKPASNGNAPAVADRNLERDLDRSVASPLRQWRDRGITTMNAPSSSDTHDPDDPCHSSPGRSCPRCNGSVYRVPRRFVDLLVSALMPVHRYRCDEMGCNWEGNLRATRQSVPSGGSVDTYEEARRDARERSQMGRETLSGAQSR
ncbi:hypothetical protein [Aromatoleum diolicum]|uniref:hypothetical protein n=1 Tax=Aromatoleum diolicum TaxID=75796 RepID=UPI001B7D10DE|nr:hypothetical protein [Aromatoleum diolicum]